MSKTSVCGAASRIRQQEGLKVPQEQAKKGRLRLMTAPVCGCGPNTPTMSAAHDLVRDRAYDGRVFRSLTIIDAFTKEALVIRVNRKLDFTDVADALTDLFILRRPPEFIKVGNDAEFIALKVRAWIATVGARTAVIEPRSPQENRCHLALLRT
jgi:putative transposase